jgi:hopanoid biosynthesis associated protein HpnK
MARVEGARRLIVNADDFGQSSAVNRAVIRAHEEGILTTASLMVNAPAAAEAVELARRHPGLGVGLHLTLVCGRAALSRNEIPGLVWREDRFSDDPVKAGLRYFFRWSLVQELEREIHAQFDRFLETGLALDQVNGHLNLHLHPTVLRILLKNWPRWAEAGLRLTHDPFRLSLRLSRGRWSYRLSHALAFGVLTRWARPKLVRQGVRHTAAVFGLLQNGEVDEAYVLRLLACLPPGDAELYSHPCLGDSEPEFRALVSPRVRDALNQAQIELIRYQDLSREQRL